MTTPSPLVLDLLEWLVAGPRSYEEVMEAWRTSCPRLSIWEDAVDGGLAVRRAGGPDGAVVDITAEGLRRLGEAGRNVR